MVQKSFGMVHSLYMDADSPLHDTLRRDMTDAMKARDEVRLSVLRGLVTLCTNELTATKRTPRDTLPTDEVLTLIRRSLKQRRDASSQFRVGNRVDLATREDAEAAILETYLPQQASDEEIANVVRTEMARLGIRDRSGVGTLIGAVMTSLKGRADGTSVRRIVETFIP